MSAIEASALLEVRGLVAGYGAADVLQGIDLDVASGSVTTVLGANGAGKTTLLRAISGLIGARGRITIGGRRIDRTPPEQIVRLGVAHVPDDRGTFAGLTVAENLALGACTRRDGPGIAGDLERMLGYFPRLRERRAQQAGTMSGGEQQMLAVARALMARPRLLLLDEPSFGLAPRIVREIFAIFSAIVAERQIAILLVEQNAPLALSFAQRACVLEAGRVVASGTADEIARDAAVRRAYLGA